MNNEINDTIKSLKKDVKNVPFARTDKWFSPVYHSTKSLRRLKRRYVSAFPYKFGISLKDIRLTSDVLAFIRLHPELSVKPNGESLVFAKRKNVKKEK